MATFRPLIIDDGQIQRIQSGDTIDPLFLPAALETQSLANENAGTINIGQPVYSSGPGQVDLAQADAAVTKDVIGLVYATTILTTASGNIITDGVMTATTGQWDAVTGDAGGLTAGTTYYLDPITPGMMTTTAPSADGDYVAPLGKALSTTKFRIEIGTTVLL